MPSLFDLMPARDATLSAIVTALRGVFPVGFRAKLTITVDGPVVKRENVAVELRQQER